MNYAEVRGGIAKYLSDNVTDVDGRVKQSWANAGDIEKPFVVFSFLGELPSADNHLGVWMQLEVNVAGVEGSFTPLDVIADQIVGLLHNQVITTTTGNFRPEFWRDSRIDYWNQELKLNVIRLKFTIPGRFRA
jgi:hypothetical protein